MYVYSYVHNTQTHRHTDTHLQAAPHNDIVLKESVYMYILYTQTQTHTPADGSS